jgi:LPS export ABC transporter protein LptC
MPMSPRRIAKALAGFGVVVLAAIAITTVWVVRHRSSAKTLEAVAGLAPGALLHAHNFHWTQMKGGESQWVLMARDANYSTDRTLVTLRDAKLSMASADGKRLSLEAPHAKLQLAGSRVSRADLDGGLTVRYGDFVLTTEQATFTPDNDELNAAGRVTIEGQGLKVIGTGLVGHPKAQQFELEDDVSTHIIPRSGSADSKVL